jgi:hypothetical protein
MAQFWPVDLYLLKLAREIGFGRFALRLQPKFCRFIALGARITLITIEMLSAFPGAIWKSGIRLIKLHVTEVVRLWFGKITLSAAKCCSTTHPPLDLLARLLSAGMRWIEQILTRRHHHDCYPAYPKLVASHPTLHSRSIGVLQSERSRQKAVRLYQGSEFISLIERTHMHHVASNTPAVTEARVDIVNKQCYSVLIGVPQALVVGYLGPFVKFWSETVTGWHAFYRQSTSL